MATRLTPLDMPVLSPRRATAADLSEARRLADAYLARLGLNERERRAHILAFVKRARAAGEADLRRAVFEEAERLAGVAAPSDEAEAASPATPPEMHAPMPEHDLVAARPSRLAGAGRRLADAFLGRPPVGRHG